jgi:hypothetical protein
LAEHRDDIGVAQLTDERGTGESHEAIGVGDGSPGSVGVTLSSHERMTCRGGDDQDDEVPGGLGE